VIKMVQALRHGTLPRTLHVDRPTPRVDWSSGNVRLLLQRTQWPDTGRPRRAAVSSFGMSGTNAHVIVEQADVLADTPPASIPWVLSAASPQALRAQAARLLEHAVSRTDRTVADIGWSLAVARTRFAHRAVVVGTQRAQFLDGLASVAAGEPGSAVAYGTVPAEPGRTVFVFPGQGGQWVGMARELLEYSPAFARAVERCESALAEHCDWSLSDVLRGREGAASLDRVDVVQPALFAVMVALAEVWGSLGVRPDAVVGHSQGEIAAACVAGALSLEDAARLVARRSRALTELAGSGGLLSAALSEEQARRFLAPWAGRLTVSVVNSPQSVVIAGEPEALEEALAELDRAQVRARRIPVDYAAHTAQVEAIEGRILAVAREVVAHEPTVPFYSTVDGEPSTGLGTDPGYWYRNLRRPVRFADTVRAILAEGGQVRFIEVSPHPVLAACLEDLAAEAQRQDVAVLGTLRRGEGGPERLALSLAGAHAAGIEPDWAAVFAGLRPRRVDLPTYAFQRRRFWADPAVVLPAARQDGPPPGSSTAEHPFLTSAVELPDGGMVLAGTVSLAAWPWLVDRAIADGPVMPETGFVELALEAGVRAGCPAVRQMTLQAPLALGADPVELRVMAQAADGDGTRRFAVHARISGADGQPWIEHARGLLTPNAPGAAEAYEASHAWPPDRADPLNPAEVYRGLAERGLEYGPGFQGLRAAWCDGERVFAEVSLPEEAAAGDPAFHLHPVLLDAALQAMSALPGSGSRTLTSFEWSGVTVHPPAPAVPMPTKLYLEVCPVGAAEVRIGLFDQAGHLLAAVDSVESRPAPPQLFEQARASAAAMLLHPRWPDAPDPAWVESEHDDNHDDSVAVLGADDGIMALAGLVDEKRAVRRYADFDALEHSLGPGIQGPHTVLWTVDSALSPDSNTPAAVVEQTVQATLDRLRRWLAEDRFADSRLVLITRNAVATAADDDPPDPCLAAVWGLARCAQAEHPGRFVLADVDEHPASWRALLPAVRSGEPQIAIRSGAMRVFRLERVARQPGPSPDAVFRCGPEDTVLIADGIGALGGLMARHLVEHHGVRRLLLAGSVDPAAPEATRLAADLAAAGAKVEFVACDLADRDSAAEVLAAAPGGHPFTVIVHCPEIQDLGTAGTRTEEQARRVLGAQAAAALNLDLLARSEHLREFVFCSSMSGVFGAAGRGYHAAAAALLGALAESRRSTGLPARCLAWGPWQGHGDTIGRFGDADARRLRFGGAVGTLPGRAALALFDAAVRRDEVLAVPLALDLLALSAEASGTVPHALRDITDVVRGEVCPAPAERLGAAGAEPAELGLLERLCHLDGADRHAELVALVRRRAAAVLRYPNAEAVPADRPFKDLGLDSLSALELRNRIGADVGRRLPASTAFNHPTSRRLAEHLADLLWPRESAHSTPFAPSAPESGPGSLADGQIDAMDTEALIAWVMQEVPS
jgi:acyl transferase domain-containing protein